MARLSVTQAEPCWDIGMALLVNGTERMWGDVDAVDALKNLRAVAGLSVDRATGDAGDRPGSAGRNHRRPGPYVYTDPYSNADADPYPRSARLACSG